MLEPRPRRAAPTVSKLFCAPGNAGYCHPGKVRDQLDVADHAAVTRFCAENGIGLVAVGPEVPLVAGLADDLDTAGIKVFGPSKAAAQLEGSKGFTKDLCAEFSIPTAAYGRFKDAASAKAYLRRADTSHRREGGRSRRRQGRDRRDDARGSRGGHRRLLRRRVRRGRRGSGDRGIPRRRGSELLRARATATRAAAGDCAGPQARRRWRHRPQHRRHGRLLACAGDDAELIDARCRDHPPTVRGMATRGTPFKGVCTPA